MEKTRVGIVGCGAISRTYLGNKDLCPILDVTTVADIVPELAGQTAREHGVLARSVDALIDDPEIQIVVILTPPSSHHDLCRRVLEAGKHAYTEKPMGIDSREAAELDALSGRTGRRLGCAPDTFLCGAQQHCRNIIDSGAIGEVFSGNAVFTVPGYARKQFFADPGAGPLFDLGVYLVTNLVNLVGPVRRVAAFTGRELESYEEPESGASVQFRVPTRFSAILEFAAGAAVTLTTAWGIKRPYAPHIDLFGTNGAVYVPDPNQFRAIEAFTMTRADMLAGKPEQWTTEEVPVRWPNASFNPRILGVGDMAHAIRSGRPHRASAALGRHVVEVMEKMTRSAETGVIERIETEPRRPAPVDPDLPDGVFE